MAKSPLMDVRFRYLIADEGEDESGEREYRKTIALPRPMDIRSDFRAIAKFIVTDELQKKEPADLEGLFGFMLSGGPPSNPIERMCWLCPNPDAIITLHDTKKLVGRRTFLKVTKADVAKTIDNYFAAYNRRKGVLVWSWGDDFSTQAAYKNYYLNAEIIFLGLLGNTAVAVDPYDGNEVSIANEIPVARRAKQQPKRAREREPA